MKVSREQMAENRQRILDAAGELFRAKGFEAVSVAEVMKAAGLTHGGFYGHFSSKDDLVAQTLSHVFCTTAEGAGGLDDFLKTYLSALHRDNPALGCPTAGLAADVRYQSPAARQAMADGVAAQIGRISGVLPNKDPAQTRQAAIGIWSAMVGAVILSRAVGEGTLSDEILQQTLDWIKGRDNPPED